VSTKARTVRSAAQNLSVAVEQTPVLDQLHGAPWLDFCAGCGQHAPTQLAGEPRLERGLLQGVGHPLDQGKTWCHLPHLKGMSRAALVFQSGKCDKERSGKSADSSYFH